MSHWISLREAVSRIVFATSEKFQEDQLSLRAASLTYTTLVSLVPFLAVAFAVLKAFGVHSQIEPLLTRAFEPLGPEGGEITHRVLEFVDNLRVGVLGTVGMVTLFYTVVSVIGKVEDALNAIWNVQHARSWTQRVRDYLSVVLVGPVFIFAAFALTASAQSYWIVQRFLEITPLGFTAVVTTRVIPFLFLSVAFTFLYWFVPNTPVRVGSAAIGGMIAAILWQGAGAGFAAFVASSTRYAAIYSSFAVLIIFLLWLYIGWLIVLVGAEISYMSQYHLFSLERWREKENAPSSRERWALELLREITTRYLSGSAPQNLAALAARLNIPLVRAEEIVDSCVQQGILLRAVEPEGISLARPPEQVLVIEILELLQNRDSIQSVNGEDNVVLQLLHCRDQAVHQALSGVTLKSLVAGVEKDISESASAEFQIQ